MWYSKNIQKDAKIKLGLICFRDKAEKLSDEPETWKTVPLDFDHTKLIYVLEKEKAVGGNDVPEDIKGAFKIVLEDEGFWKYVDS